MSTLGNPSYFFYKLLIYEKDVKMLKWIINRTDEIKPYEMIAF